MKHIKKILCLTLTLIMVFSSASVAVGAITIGNEEIDHLPQVYISGFGSRILHYKDDPEKTSLFFPVNFDLMMNNLSRFDKYAADSLKNLDPDIIYNYLYNAFKDTFGAAALKGDGITNADENVVCEPTVLDYDGDGVYNFNYDSRLSPIDLAADLKDYIGLVQEHSGSEKIELIGASYGTTILMAFLNDYPEMHKYIDSVLISVPSYGGFSVVGEIFSGDFFINHDTLTEYAYVGINNEDLGLFLSVLNKSGFLKIFLECMLIPTLKAVALEAAMDVIRDIFGTIPAMWTFVQEEYFYDAMVNLYGENYADPGRENAGLISKVTYYQEQVMQRLDEIYLATQANGVKMNIICKYGRPPMPISEKGSFMSDGAVDVKDVTLGATASRYGETLPEDYTQARYPEYDFISPDKCIDASTGIDPLHTWYVKGLEHTIKNDGFNELIDYILYEDPTVFSGDRFPQYTQATEDGGLAPVTEPEIREETSLFTDYIKLIIRIFELIIETIKGLFAK
ncbi:MAG: hypothetical protein IJB74_06560 [Clostridia bacterium]|nr:hypothetical protein [Clostridia bacterium]